METYKLVFNLFKRNDPEKKQDQNAGLLTRLKNGLSKTRQILTTDINKLFVSGKVIDDSFFEEQGPRPITQSRRQRYMLILYKREVLLLHK